MDAESNLTNHFLIAMPGLQDPNFHHSVTYICEHNEQGAMGIVINHTLDLSVADVLEHMQVEDIPARLGSQPVFRGGPVETERGFVLHDNSHNWDSTLQVTEQISITTSRDILESMARGDGPEQALVALGYAGWGAGQLEQEISDNAWLSGPANADILFEMPVERRWEAAAALLGVDLNLLSTETGHA